MPPSKVVRLPLRVRKVLSANGRDRTTGVVHCPRCDQSINEKACFHCDGMIAQRWSPVDGARIVCARGKLEDTVPVDARRMDFAEAAARCKLHEIVEPVSVFATPDLMLSKLGHVLLEADVRAAPVVDDEERLVGVITRSDLLRATSPEALVGDVMPSPVHALPEHAPIGYAIALMAMENVSAVPVVTDSGRVVGLVHAIDTLRWIGQRMGYVLPTAVEEESATIDATGAQAPR